MATIDTIANRSTGSAIAGKAYFETSTNKFIVFNGTAWIELDSDGTGAVLFENRWGASLDGTDDYLTANDSNLATSGDCTISLWFNSASLPGSGGFDYMFSLTDGRAAGKDRAIGISGTGSDAQIVANTYGSGWNLPFTNTSISADTWYHVAVVFTSSSAQVYFNGADKGSKTVTTNTISYNQTVIGGMLYSSANHFNGKIDDVSVFHSALSSTDITAIYNSGVPADISSLSPVGYWRMGDDSNDSATAGGAIATITDSSGNGNDATQSTASNQPTFKALAQSATSVSFDGSNDTLSVSDSSLDLKTDFTLSCWFNRGSGAGAWDGLVSWGEPSGGKYRSIGFNANNQLTFNSYGAPFSTTGPSLTSSKWYHGAVTLSGTGASAEAKVYVDGSLVSTVGLSLNDYTTYSETTFGGSGYGGAERFEGAIDEVAIFNSVLSASDVSSLAANRGAHLINDLSLSPTAYYRMGEDDSLTDGASVSQISDASGNGNHATQATAANQPTASVKNVIYV